jgi:hypothetical protein
VFEAATETGEAAKKAGIEGGMNLKFTLTGQEKIMNMAKLGIVSRNEIGFYRGNLFNKIKMMRKSLYTLCVLSLHINMLLSQFVYTATANT